MKKSELKKLIKEAAKDLNLYSKPSYVGKLSEKQLKLLQEQDGVAAGSGAALNGYSDPAFGVRGLNNVVVCRTPNLRRLSINDTGLLSNIGYFSAYQGQSTAAPSGPVYQHIQDIDSSLGVYIPACRNYPHKCIADGDNEQTVTLQNSDFGNLYEYSGPMPYEVGQCFK